MSQLPQIVWLKRDLRVEDHAALCEAAARGPVIALAVFEPSLWAAADASGRHSGFYAQSLDEAGRNLYRLGVPLLCARGEMLVVLDAIARRQPFRLVSHEETGNWLSFQRDLEVKRWCEKSGTQWFEAIQNNVVRRLQDRNGWAAIWEQRMASPRRGVPPFQSLDESSKTLLKQLLCAESSLPESGAIEIRRFNPDQPSLALKAWREHAQSDPCPGMQRGGRAAGLALLKSFLDGRGMHYRYHMSSPGTGENACSRLSPHLAWGTLSVGEVVAALRSAKHDWLKDSANPDQQRMLESLRSFESRLHWRCHFAQKLESEPEIEFRCLHPATRGIRNETELSEHEALRLKAWIDGQTGFPFVDACMRYLRHGGWINFRMRAMLMSFASQHLWLHWRKTGEHLARMYTDYDPGIHWPQVQMQSGTTGINTIRIYNPDKQWMDQDPDNRFVDKWVPEWQSDDYPDPIVDQASVAKQAREILWGLRKSRVSKDQANAVFERHGSRLRSGRSARRSKRSRAASDPTTPDLFG